MSSQLQEKGLIALSLLLALSAFHGLPWAVFFFPGMLGHALRRRDGWARVALAGGWGVGFCLIFYHWVGGYGLVPWLALALVRGLPWALFPLPELAWRWLVLRRGWSSGTSAAVPILGGALGLALVSQALLLGITGVDWESPAAPLTAWPQLLFPLPWLGLAGMALLLGLLSNLLLSTRPRAVTLGLALAACWLGWSAIPRATKPALGLDLALLQTGSPQHEKWDRAKADQAIANLLEATAGAAEKGADLVIWPETAWPYQGMRRRVTNTRKVGKTARRLKTDILASSIEENPASDPPQWHNSVSLVSASGRFVDHYDKRRLAPFAEYIPLPRSWQPWLRQFAPFSRISHYIPGEREALFQTSSGLTFGVMICYESMTPSYAARLARRADFLVVVTNDAPFRNRWPNEAHFRSAILRALETGKPVMQAANTGVTGAIGSDGRVKGRTPVGFSGPSVQYVGL